MNFINNIKQSNQFPIIFIGSGITKRYFENAPEWMELLKTIWNEVDSLDSLYQRKYELQEKYGKEDSFNINVELATCLQKMYDDAFFSKKIKLYNLSLKKASEEGIDPFKQRIANIFLTLKRKSECEEEIEWFSKMLIKARMVLTTNYDTFIEECFNSVNTSVQVHVGNKGLFQKTEDYGELYKIHGSVDDVNTISITKEDYQNNEKKSALIDAKILSNLTESPIIFLGYSLTDQNVQKLLNSFVENAPFDISQAASRIGVVEYAKDNMNFVEAIEGMPNNKIHYTSIKTDNYLEIYKELASIDQSYTPAEIRKYANSFRRIIEVKGQENQLKTVLADYIDIDKWNNEDIKDKNIVVAFGNEKIIYTMLNFGAYLKQYFSNANIAPSLAIKFIEEQPLKTPIPIKKYLIAIRTQIHNSDSEIEKKKLTDRLDKYGNLTYSNYIKSLKYPDTGQSRLYISTQNLVILQKTKKPQEVIDLKEVKDIPKINYLTMNLNKYDRKLVDELMENLLEKDTKVITKSHYRKLFMAYSLIL